eukprot:403334862
MFEGQNIFYSDQQLVGPDGNARNAFQDPDQLPFDQAENKFMHFVLETQDREIYVYREQLQANSNKGQYFLRVNMDDLYNYDDKLSMMIRNHPADFMPVFEKAVQIVYQTHYFHQNFEQGEEVPKFQVQIHSQENPRMLRDLQSHLIGKLIVIPGIITNATRTQIKATAITYKCKNCGHQKLLKTGAGYGSHQYPRVCDNQRNPGLDKQQCKLDSYQVLTDRCEYIDQQSLKIQEAPELVPTGEMPRTFSLLCDRYLADKVTPGNRVKIVGILSILGRGSNSNANKQIKNYVQVSYIRVLGIMSEVNKDGVNTTGFALPNISNEDEEKFINMSKDPNVFNKVSRSIASAIFGHPDIKKAIACLLFGGSPKRLPDGMRLRGDINVLLLGDPSTAKSQFLKFVERVAPISVYTSGKGSSAAGLTASVLKDANGEFQLEGGAMVLADGGVVCIDEFDKMRAQDRVAIHEAMEQQTISIAKAGITTILNSRTSVLAAANPVFGRYDDLKHAAEQIDFQSSILSRFDCIFIVRDIREENADKAIASHVVNLHTTGRNMAEDNNADVSIEDLRKYITYAKMKIFPRLSEEAGQMLQDMYVSDRRASKDQKLSKKSTGIPITVRQLEAIIRLSESIARISLQTIVKREHVEEAHRLFKISTLNAAQSGMTAKTIETPQELQPMIRKIEDAIKRRVAIGTKISYPKLHQEMMSKFENAKAIDYAIISMIKRDEFQHQEGRKILARKK